MMAMKEAEIRPKNLFADYLALCEQDTYTYFADARRDYGRCPACDASGDPAFSKHGFEYELCPNCYTLFVNPRPAAEAFAKYYTESPSSKFWATTFYKETAAARREKLWKPKARSIRDALERYHAVTHAVIDIGGGYGLFAEEMRELSGQTITVIEPAPHLAEVCREKTLPVIEKFLEQVEVGDLPPGRKAFVSFELFEHLHSPAAFLDHLKELMRVGDLLIFTTLSGAGVDIQALWQDSKSVSPPHHLNFLNPVSIRNLLERLGLQVLEVTTPGKLDVDILVNNQAYIKDRFWRTFVASASEEAKQQWQNLIAASGWSSHMMVTCRKP
jgi:2-polyprenyl-3-methyl-5-hydroxy-6-metoxy-1,4-benzoquinol methylase